MCNVTFDVILFDRRAAIGWLLDVGTVTLLVDDAPAWIKKKLIISYVEKPIRILMDGLSYRVKKVNIYWKSSA